MSRHSKTSFSVDLKECIGFCMPNGITPNGITLAKQAIALVWVLAQGSPILANGRSMKVSSEKMTEARNERYIKLSWKVLKNPWTWDSLYYPTHSYTGLICTDNGILRKAIRRKKRGGQRNSSKENWKSKEGGNVGVGWGREGGILLGLPKGIPGSKEFSTTRKGGRKSRELVGGMEWGTSSREWQKAEAGNLADRHGVNLRTGKEVLPPLVGSWSFCIKTLTATPCAAMWCLLPPVARVVQVILIDPCKSFPAKHYLICATTGPVLAGQCLCLLSIVSSHSQLRKSLADLLEAQPDLAQRGNRILCQARIVFYQLKWPFQDHPIRGHLQ